MQLYTNTSVISKIYKWGIKMGPTKQSMDRLENEGRENDACKN